MTKEETIEHTSLIEKIELAEKQRAAKSECHYRRMGCVTICPNDMHCFQNIKEV